MMVHLPLLGFGSWGVDIFFVISGFIMMYVTENNHKHFLLKRIIRIVPLYWIITFGVFTLAIFYPYLLNNTTANFEHLFKSLFFIPFNKNDTGHFPVLFLGWTLNFEIIFYILFSVSLFFSKNNKFIICSVLIILFLFLNFTFSEKDFIFSAYSNYIFLEFIFGMMAYKIWKKFNNTSSISSLNHFLFLLTAFLIVVILNSISSTRTIIFGIPSFLLLIYFLFFLKDIKFPKTLVILGDASYCMYLLHPYIIQFFYKILDLGKYELFLQIGVTIIIIVLVCAISILIFRFIEMPINNNLKQKFKI